MIFKRIEELKKERAEQEAREKMEFELYKEMMDEQGLSQKDRINKSLEEFAKLDDLEKLHSTFENIIDKSKDQKDIIS